MVCAFNNLVFVMATHLYFFIIILFLSDQRLVLLLVPPWNRPCQLIFAGFYTSGHRQVHPRAAEVEFHGFQCRPDSCSEHLSLNNDLLNTIGIQIGKYF